MEDDPISFLEAIKSSNAHKWTDGINEELKSMKDNDVWDLIPLPDGMRPVRYGFSKPKGTHKAMWKDIRYVLSLRITLNVKALITKRLSLNFLRKSL